MKIYKYNNYDDYINAQILANKRKITKIWIKEETVKSIFNNYPTANKILCHGTRNGKEQQFFINYFNNAKVIGTEISDNASQYKNTVQHDFHEVCAEWIGTFDIVYSNSWDHSYDPKKSLMVWRDQLNHSGRLYLEQALDPTDNRSRESDPLEIYHDEILELFEQVGLKLIDTFNSSGGEDNHPCIIYIAEVTKQHTIL